MDTTKDLLIADLSDEMLLYKIEYYSEKYYNEQPVITDVDFDLYKDEAIRRGLTINVGAKVYGDEVSHPNPMLSLGKVQVNSEEIQDEHLDLIANKLKRSNTKHTPLYATFKFDGLAINLKYNEVGEIVDAVTRGDGSVGKSVFKKLSHLIPKQVMHGISEIRCECVMPQSIFDEKYSDEYSHARNLAVGILNDIDVTDKRKYDLRLIALQTIGIDGMCVPFDVDGDIGGSNNLPSNFLAHYDAGDVYENLDDFTSFKNVYPLFEEKRSQLDYPTDGIVIGYIETHVSDANSHEPFGHLAIKFPPKGKVAEVAEVEWAIKKTGEWIPKVILEPVVIDGRKITKVHGYNYGFISENRIAKGAKVLINIAGDIIPRIDAVVEESSIEPIYPETGVVEGCHLMAVDANDEIALLKFLKGCEILGFKHFSDASFKKVYRIISSPLDIFNSELINEENLQEVGFGERQSEKLMEAIEIRRNEGIDLKNLIYAFQYDNCGESTSEQIALWYCKEHLEYSVNYDFKGKQHNVIDYYTKGDGLEKIHYSRRYLSDFYVNINYPKPAENFDAEVVHFILTGSPKNAGFKTKAVFKEELPPNWVEVKTVKQSDVLITDSLESKSSKMKQAISMGKTVKTYFDDFTP